jgi:serine/threonine protein kinase/Tfp pilus assembly protein PilF
MKWYPAQCKEEWDRLKDRAVAIKTIRPELLADLDFRDRFLKESRVWVDLGIHPNIVQCYEVNYENPVTYLALELITAEQFNSNSSLRGWITLGQRAPISQSIAFAIQIARGLEYASGKISHFVHRDLKPENILVGADKLSNWDVNRLRITDFGLATVKSRISSLEKNDVAGTPHYMAPEQWQGRPLGIYTDVYAFGCVFYEMLTGNKAVSGKTLADIKNAHCNGLEFPLFPHDLPKDLKKLLIRCVALVPEKRYSDWHSVLNILESMYFDITKHEVPKLEIGHLTEKSERSQSGWSLNALGSAYLDMGNTQAALEAFTHSTKIAHANGDRKLEGAGINNQGIVYKHLGQNHKAIECHIKGAEIAHNIGDSHGEASAFGNLGNAYSNLNNSRKAFEYYDKQFDIATKIMDIKLVGNALQGLGNSCADIGEYQKAIKYFELNLKISRELGDIKREALSTSGIASVFYKLGKFQEAINFYEKCLAIADRINDLLGKVEALQGLGASYSALGNIHMAVDFYQKQLGVSKKIGHRQSEADTLSNLGNISFRIREYKKAIEYLENELIILNEIDNKFRQVLCLNRLGEAYYSLKNMVQAVEHHERALMIADKIGDSRGQCQVANSLGNAYYVQGRLDIAETYYEKQLLIAREIGNKSSEGAALGNLGNIYADRGENDKAIEIYKQHLVIAKEIGDQAGYAGDSFNLALLLYKSMNQPQQALWYAEEAVRSYEQLGNSGELQMAKKLFAELKKDLPL